MNTRIVTGSLLAVWLISFLMCILVPFYFRRDIPTNFGALIKQAFDTFAQTLAAMIAFIFAKRQNEPDPATKQGSVFVDLCAIILSLIYVIIFDSIIVLFATGKLRADEAVQLFQDYRPYVAFLVTAAVAYYFGSNRS